MTKSLILSHVVKQINPVEAIVLINVLLSTARNSATVQLDMNLACLEALSVSVCLKKLPNKISDGGLVLIRHK